MPKLEDEELWFKAAILYFISTLLFPESHQVTSLKYASLLEQDVERLEEYNWCAHVLQYTTDILESVDDIYISANFHFLLVNYFDRMGLRSPLASNSVDAPTVVSVNFAKRKPEMALIFNHVGLSSAVKAGAKRVDDDGVAKTVIWINADTCEKEKLLDYAKCCKEQISLLNDQLKKFEGRKGSSPIKKRSRIHDEEDNQTAKKKKTDARQILPKKVVDDKKRKKVEVVGRSLWLQRHMFQ